MHRARLIVLVTLALLVGLSLSLRADVKTEEKSQVKFEGMMGKMMGMFGGKAAKEGLISKVSAKGNRKMTVDDYTGQITSIPSTEEKVYTLEHAQEKDV